MTETTAPTGTCRNCGGALASPYCGQCGQQDRPINPSLFSLVGEAIAEASDVDGKLLRSVRFLFTRPGFLTNELFAGRRASYVSPLRLYLVFSVILFAVSAVVANRALVMPSEGNRIDLGGGMSIWWDDAKPGDRERTIQQAERQVAVRTTWLPRAMFVAVPLLALAVMVLTWRSGRRFPQHLQFTAHVQAVVFAGSALLIALPRLPSGSFAEVWKAAWGLASLWSAVILAVVVHTVMAFKSVYGGGWFSNSLRTVVVALMFAVLWNAAGSLILWYSSVLG
jgi:hypothetical protein